MLLPPVWEAIRASSLLAAVLLLQAPRSGKTVVVWLLSGLVGILLGSTLPLAACYLTGYRIALSRSGEIPAAAAAGAGGPPPMGGMGGPPEPSPKRDLSNVVRKLALLTGDVGIALSEEQAASLTSCLADVEKAETMSDDDAQAKHDEILALLDEDQKSRLEAVGLPGRRPGGPGGMGGPGPGGPGGMPGMGGPEQAEDANPFQEESNAEALGVLRERFAPGDAPADGPPAEGEAPAESSPAEGDAPAESPPAESDAPAESPPAEGEAPSEAPPAEEQQE